MPWDKHQSGEKWEVINSDTGDVKGTHDSEEEADEQIAALYANVEEEDMEKISMFIPIMKVNAERREVWGFAAIEEVDNSDEILDYESSKPHFLDWSNRAQKRSGGKSLGNLRSMHQNIAAGKLIELRPDDVSKGFYVGAKIIDDGEWKKVEQGVYTGFSVGGSYLKRWQDFRNPGKMRYTAKPTELSIVDSPCIPSATFEMVKADGMVEEVEFMPGDGENEMELDLEDDELEKAWDESKHPRDPGGEGGGQWISGGGGSVDAPPEKKQRDRPYGRNPMGVGTKMGGQSRRQQDKMFDQLREGSHGNESAKERKEREDKFEPNYGERGKDKKPGKAAWMDKPRPEEGYKPDYGDQPKGAPPKESDSLPAHIAAHHKKAKSHINDIKSLLGEHSKQFSKDPGNWGYVGDLGHVETLLDDMMEGSWKNPGEAIYDGEYKTAQQGYKDRTDRIARKMKIVENGINDMAAESKGKGNWGYAGSLEHYASSLNEIRTFMRNEEPDDDGDHEYRKVSKGEVMEKLERIYAILDGIEEELLKSDIPGAPEPVADIPLTGEYGSATVEQMPPPSVLMELEPNAEPSQEVLATHAVNSKDLTSAFNAWLPKVGAIVKSSVAEALAKAPVDLGKVTESVPVRTILVKRNNKVQVVRKEQ